jgi:hypothetical protein
MVASMKTAMNLEDRSKTGGPMVFDLNDFYMKQRKESAKNIGQQNEAANNLHDFKGRVKPSSSGIGGDDKNGVADAENQAATDLINVQARASLDFSGKDYRGFIFVIHEDFGLMMLYCTHKRKKGPHFQLPGGHVDEAEFISACT